MLKPRELPQAATGGPAAGAAALAQPQGFGTRKVAAPDAESRFARLMRRKAEWLSRIESYDWAPDLAEDIGSARWFRGLGTMVGLTVTALAFWPEGQAVAGSPAIPLDAGARNEFRSQMIQPLALGGDSGRRMGATSAVSALAFTPERTSVSLTATLAQGDSFGRMLMRAGVSDADTGAVMNLLSGVVAPGAIPAGTQADIHLGQAGPDGARSLDHLAFRARFDLDVTVSRIDGRLVVTPQPIAVDTTPLRIRGVVGSSLYLSARSAGAPIGAIQEYLQTLDQHMSLDTAIETGDTFDIIVSSKRSSTGEVEFGDLLFAGLEHDGRNKAQLLRWGGDGQFFEASGMGAQRTGLIMPVVGGHITSGFGQRRHPILGYTRMHAGVDFGAAYGSPIYAVGDATVIYSGWHGGHGNYVKLDHGGGFATGYGHMSRIAVASGTHVRAGQVIGYVGSTGLSTGPHLHYELYRNGAPVNPLSVSFTVSTQVDQKELIAFKARMAQLKGVKPGAAMTSLGPRQAAATATPRREIDKLGS